MDSLFVAAACLLGGALLRRLERLPAGADRAVAGVVIQVSAPAVAFLAGRGMPLGPEILLPASMAWVLFAGALAVFGLGRRLLGYSPQTFGCLVLTAGMSNIVFLGLPMIEAFFGHEMVYVAFLCDGPGGSLVLALPGVLLAAHLSGKNAQGGAAMRILTALRRVALFPPLQALVLGLALRPLALPEWLLSGLARIGTTLVPLSLLAVGLGLSLKAPRGKLGPLALGLGYKLALAPALMWLAAALAFGNSGPVAQVTVFEAAMPPMVLGGIVAADNGLDPDLAALLVGLGTPLSFLTLPLWRLALNWM